MEGRSDPAHVSTSYAERANLTLRCTPAMAAGVSKTLWELADMVQVLEGWEASQGVP